MFDFFKRIFGKKEVDLRKKYEIELESIQNDVEYFKTNHDFSIYKPDVGVFGVNSAGKSTFLNSLLGEEVFKMGIGETTKEITCLFNGDIHSKIDEVIYKKEKFYHLDYF